MNEILILILAMMLVTYIPRLIPFLVVSKIKPHRRIELFLKCVPYAALGALIIPGAFTVTPQIPHASLLGLIFTFIYGWYRGGIIILVLGAVIVTFLVLMIN